MAGFVDASRARAISGAASSWRKRRTSRTPSGGWRWPVRSSPARSRASARCSGCSAAAAWPTRRRSGGGWTRSPPRLLGLEGESSKLWFSAFGALLRNPELPWNGRSRRPPRDGVNACLSFLYTLLASRVEDAARRVGLLPDLGALHEPGSGRAALVFDLVEEFRAPLVDRLVLRLINLRQLSPEDFEDPAWSRPTFAAGQPVRASGAVYLGELGRRLVLTSWGALLRSDVTDATDGSRVAVDWLLERQARRMARVFQGRDDAYRPWLPA